MHGYAATTTHSFRQIRTPATCRSSRASRHGLWRHFRSVSGTVQRACRPAQIVVGVGDYGCAVHRGSDWTLTQSGQSCDRRAGRRAGWQGLPAAGHRPARTRPLEAKAAARNRDRGSSAPGPACWRAQPRITRSSGRSLATCITSCAAAFKAGRPGRSRSLMLGARPAGGTPRPRRPG